MKRIAITAPHEVILENVPDELPLGEGQLLIRARATLVSVGTELNWAYHSAKPRTFPQYPGYAMAGVVERSAGDTGQIAPGDTVFCTASHASHAVVGASRVVKIPASLSAEKAVFARLMGVSMATLVRTHVPPPSAVLVAGLGPVGNLAAQVFARCGYAVTGFDPSPERRAVAESSGLIARETAEGGPYSLLLECSGQERAVLEGIRLMRAGGEVRLIGVPWEQKADISAHEILTEVFHRYVSIHSGWEWEVPLEMLPHSHGAHLENYTEALRWLSEGQIKVDDLYETVSPETCADVYKALLDRTFPAPTAVFVWSSE